MRRTFLNASVSVMLNFASYSAWTLCNKYQFLHGLSPYALTLTAFQMFIAGLIAFVLVILCNIERPLVASSKKQQLWSRYMMWNQILPLGISRAIDIGCSNVALSLVSVALQQIMKSMLPFFVCVLTVHVLKRRVTLASWLSLLPIVGGTVLASVGEASFSTVGAVLATISCLGRSCKAILNSKLVNGDVTHSSTSPSSIVLTPLSVLLLEAPTTACLILVPALLLEHSPFHSSRWKTYHNSPTPLPSLWSYQQCVWFNLVAGVLMFVNQASYITVIHQTSALSCQVLMNVKMLLLIVVALHVFDQPFGVSNQLGVVLACAGCFCYAASVAKDSGWAKSLVFSKRRQIVIV